MTRSARSSSQDRAVPSVRAPSSARPAATRSTTRSRPGDQIIHNGIRRDGGGRVVLRIFKSLKPVIAAVNGAAVGVGATMQLPMDFRIASTTAKFGFVFARRGITPEACSSWFLPRLVGGANGA